MSTLAFVSQDQPPPLVEPAADRSVPILGRTDELCQIESFLDQLASSPLTIALEGEAGIGKTALCRAASSAARRRGYSLLACHPIDSESSLAYAALGDLLQDVLDEALPELPAPQCHALRVATLLEEVEERPPDRRTISVATLSLLRAISVAAPVLVVIDDVTNIDVASMRVLEFAFRRLDSERVGMLVTMRSGLQHPLPPLLDRAATQREPERLTLGPLSSDAVAQLVRSRLGAGVPRSVAAEIAEASGGNPLFALELAGAVLRGEIQRARGGRLSVPATLQQFVGNRLADLPDEAGEILFLAAAAAEPTMALLQKSADRHQVRRAVDMACERGIVELSGDQIRFSHSLVASTAYHSIGEQRRRALHRRLANAASDPDERARHLARSAVGADTSVADALDQAAERAAARGAPDAAADLAEQARDMTPDSDAADQVRRSVQAAEHHFAAGATARARQLLEEAMHRVEAGPVRADVRRRLAKVRYRNDSCSAAAELLSTALTEVGTEARLRAAIERDLGWAIALGGDVRAAAAHARAALASLQSVGSFQSVGADGMQAELLAAAAMADFALGGGINWSLIGRAIELERPNHEVPIEWRPSMMLAMMLKWSGDLERARCRFHALYRNAAESGDESSLPFLLMQMSEGATWAGDLAAALKHADEAHAIALTTGQEPIRAGVLYARALAEAHLGRLDEARASAHAGLELGERVGSVISMMLSQSVLGFIELSTDEPAKAHQWLGPLIEQHQSVGIREPGILRFVPDEVEALTALGDLERADQLLTAYEKDAARLKREWAMLIAARCRALLAAAAGRSSRAAALLRRALDRHGGASPAFEHARSLLALASIERRGRHRRAARAALDEAAAIFDALGERTWADRAHSLHGPPAAEDGDQVAVLLTPAERRVADLVAHGATNREAADRLFVTIRAVEVHLTSIYRKLGISSRTQLVLRVAAGARAEPGSGSQAKQARLRLPT